MGFDISMWSSKFEFQQVHIHIKAKVPCCRKKIFAMAVFHSLVWHPRCVVDISDNGVRTVSIYSHISAFISEQCRVACAGMFDRDRIAGRRVDVSALCQSRFFILVLYCNATFYDIDERFQSFSAKWRVAPVLMYGNQVIRKRCSHRRWSKDCHVTVFVSRNCVLYDSVRFDHRITSHFHNGSCIQKIFTIACLTI